MTADTKLKGLFALVCLMAVLSALVDFTTWIMSFLVDGVFSAIIIGAFWLALKIARKEMGNES